MDKSLYEPSLKDENWSGLKSYEIGKLFYVAFIGGLVPMMIIGNRNANWLKVDKKKVNLMLALGIILLIIKIAIFGWAFRNGFSMEQFKQLSQVREMRWGFRIMALVYFVGYYQVMKDKFIQYLATVGEPIPLLKDALIWIFLGGIIEFALLILGGVLFSYVF